MPIPPHLRGRPFLLSEALAAGLTPAMLRGERFRRVRYGVYAEATMADDLQTRVDGARLVLPLSAVLSHATAAALRGLPVPATQLIHVTLLADVERSRAEGVRCHQGDVRSEAYQGRPLSAPTQNFVELGEDLGLVDLVVLGDAMVRLGLVTTNGLRAAATEARPRRGVRLARVAARLVRPGVDSPMETRARLLIVLAGLPEPHPNFVVHDDAGGWIGPVDLAYPALRIAIEYHGDVHRRRSGRWRSDIAKAELLKEIGWTVLILTATDLHDRPERTLVRVRKALSDAGHPSLPSEFSPAWRKYLMPQWAADRVEWAHADRAS